MRNADIMNQTEKKELLFSNMDLRKLIFPLILEQTLAITVGMADTMMISSVGESAVSGVSLVDMLNVLIFGVLSALATGGAVVASRCCNSFRIIPYGNGNDIVYFVKKSEAYNLF